MAKVALVNRELRRQKMVAKYADKRSTLKATAKDESLSVEERFKARLKLAKLPRNSSRVRLHNRCKLTGRPKGYMRKFGISRVTFREMASDGKIPGVTKASW